MKKDKDRREGKGRRCCLGDRIDSMYCRASYFAPGWYDERDEFILFSNRPGNDLCLRFCLYPSSMPVTNYYSGPAYPVSRAWLCLSSVWRGVLRRQSTVWWAGPGGQPRLAVSLRVVLRGAEAWAQGDRADPDISTTRRNSSPAIIKIPWSL